MCRRGGWKLESAVAIAVSFVVVLTAVDPASAQRGRSFRRLFGVSRAQLASLPEVETELKMNDQQKARVTEVNDKLRDDRRELWGTAFDGWSAIHGRLEQLGAEASQKVNEVLDPTQRKRLQEISIQQNGPRALHDADVVAELGLSTEQQTKLTAAIADNTKAFESEFGQSNGETWRHRSEEVADEADRRLLGVLNTEQRTKFEQLKGAPLEVDLSQLFRRGRGNR